MFMDRAERQLRLIAEVVVMSKDQGLELWLRGGWAMDFFLGRITHEHRDIDWFAWSGDATGLPAALAGPRHRPAPPRRGGRRGRGIIPTPRPRTSRRPA